MKKLLLILLCLPMIGFGQNVPQGINYQAVARDSSGDVLMNQSLTIQFSIISDITTSAVSWQETHTVSTNDYGLYTAIIGQGTATSVGFSATFDVIDWGASNHLLKVEVDYGNGLVDMGTTTFMSVPYSIYSANLQSSDTIKTIILEVVDSVGNDIVKFDGTNKTTTINFNSSTSSGALIFKDNNGNTSTFIKQQGTTLVMEGSDLQVGSVGVEKDINAAEITGWFNTRDYYVTAVSSNPSVGTSAEGIIAYTSITNVCPGGVEIIPTTGATIYIEPPATGIYTITITGIWSGDAWGSGDQRQPQLTLRGPPYYGSTFPEVIAQQGATRFVDQAGQYVNYQTFNWTGRMVQNYGGLQAQYSIYAKNNGGSTRSFNGKIQVTRIN